MGRLAGLGLTTLLGVATIGSAAAATMTFQVDTWSGGTDFDDSVSPLFAALKNATSLSIAGPGYVHSHGGALTADLQVFDMASGQWVTIQDVALNNGNQYYYDGQTYTINGLTIDQIQLISNPGQGSSFHSWDGTIFTITYNDVSGFINPFGHSARLAIPCLKTPKNQSPPTCTSSRRRNPNVFSSRSESGKKGGGPVSGKLTRETKKLLPSLVLVSRTTLSTARPSALASAASKARPTALAVSGFTSANICPFAGVWRVSTEGFGIDQGVGHPDPTFAFHQLLLQLLPGEPNDQRGAGILQSCAHKRSVESRLCLTPTAMACRRYSSEQLL